MARHRILVGVDGSAGSIEALRWSIETAKARDSEVTALMTWELPVAASSPETAWARSIDWTQTEREAGEVLNRVISDAADGYPVTAKVAEGPAARALIDGSKDADLVVVGSRGRGGFTALLLGSVSNQVAHHAQCPVVIIPTSETR